MKIKKIVMLLLACMLFLGSSESVLASEYVDVSPDDWYYSSVMYMKKQNIMTGMDATHFVPGGENGYLQRQDLAVILGRHYKKIKNTQQDFTSKDGSYYGGYVDWVKSQGIMNGYENGNFGVGDAITRQDLITTLYRYAEKFAIYTSIHGTFDGQTEQFYRTYIDAYSINEYAVVSMEKAVNSGILKGYEADGVKTLDPNGLVTRGMAAVMLQRFLNIYEHYM